MFLSLCIQTKLLIFSDPINHFLFRCFGWFTSITWPGSHVTSGRGHCMGMYGQLNEPPLSSMSRMRVSIGVLPTSRTKNSCSMTWAETVRREGSRSSSLPKRVGWAGYWVRTYSSRAHCDFSCTFSTCVTSVRPHASTHTDHPWDALR